MEAVCRREDVSLTDDRSAAHVRPIEEMQFTLAFAGVHPNMAVSDGGHPREGGRGVVERTAGDVLDSVGIRFNPLAAIRLCSWGISSL